MSLKHSYTVLAPLYDAMVEKPLAQQRLVSLARLGDVDGKTILVDGIGSGLDIPHLPPGAKYIGADITPAMLKRAEQRAQNANCDIELVEADCMQLPFDDNQFDHVIMHLILAVVPKPERALQEACRVLKPGGKVFIYDKFIKPGQIALARRLLNLFIRHIATRTDVVFEQVLATCPELVVIKDEPALAGGWFRLIELQKIDHS